MSFVNFIISLVLIGAMCGVISFLKWSLKNVEFSKKPKIQFFAEISVKVAIGIVGILLAYVVIQNLFILIAPLTETLDVAFSSALDKILSFLAKLVPFAVLIAIAKYYWKNRNKKDGGDGGNGSGGGEVDRELQRQRANEIYPTLRAFMFRVICAVSESNILIKKSDPHNIETVAISGEHFYFAGQVPVFQFEAESSDEVTQELADTLRDMLQENGMKYICDFPILISPDAGGRAPFEVLRVHPLGYRICVDVVLTTADSVDLIEKSRRARVERKMQEKQKRVNTQDPLF